MSYETSNVEITTGFYEGEDHWGDEVNAALLLFSALVQAGALGRTTQDDLPDSAFYGDVYILTDGDNINKVAIYQQTGGWLYVQPKIGWRVFDRDTSELLIFQAGSGWTVFEGGGGGGLEDAPEDGTLYGRKDAAWEPFEAGDSYPTLAGHAGDVLAVNATADGVEWIDPPSGGGGGGTVYNEPAWGYGSGERSGIIGVTVTGPYNGDPRQTLRSVPINNFFFPTSNVARTITFDFNAPNRVTGLLAMQSSATGNGTWTLAGSNDNATWTDIINNFVLGGAPYGPRGGAINFLYQRSFVNETAYRYYRLSLNAGSSTDTDPYVTIFDFCAQPVANPA